ncbi:DNA polymerase IV [Niabella sp. CJ426]|uniref:DNA polymerase IV n=1 Tax=Niabella sp. CJ426 TaxID=3393740 RepID=UPI003D00198C
MLSFNRHIAHFDLDTFFVSVEQLHNPKLIGKPVLIGGDGNRGVVASCSYEARKFGIHSAMPMAVAKRLCKEAIIVRGDYENYTKYSKLITDVIADSVPNFEKASIDEFYIDLTGMDKFFGCLRFTGELKTKVVKESGLPISWGLASNKLISKVATNEVKPNGQLEIPFGNEKGFMAPLDIYKIPGVGEKTSIRLIKMGFYKAKHLAAKDPDEVTRALGKNGLELWRRANGEDDSPVIPYRESKSISTEETFQTDSIDIDALLSKMVRMTEAIAFELRKGQRLTGCVTIKIRYSDFETHTAQRSIPYTNSDHVLFAIAKELFQELYTRRVLVRLIGVRFSNLIPGTYQINLFEDTQETIRLYQAIDSVKKQFGEAKLFRGSADRRQ